MGNISGAMVFQATLPVALGLAFSDWALSGTAKVSIVLGVLGAITVGANLRLRGSIEPPAIAICALLYLVFIAYISVLA